MPSFCEYFSKLCKQQICDIYTYVLERYSLQSFGLVEVFTPQPLRVVRVLFSPMACLDGRRGRRLEKACPGCISETVRCKMLILGRDISSGL